MIGRVLCFGLISYSTAFASPLSLAELLQQTQQAARQLDYAGFLSYSNSAGVESMHLVHIVDGKGERERLEVLDGMAREFIRLNEVTQCLIPDQKLIIQEKSRDDRFPALLNGDVSQIEQFYTFNKEEVKRVAGRECQEYSLRPIDAWRYGYAICVDTEYHLLLKLQTLSANTDAKIINQVAFANVVIGKDVTAESLNTTLEHEDWKVIQANMQQTNLAAQGWRIPYPAGFLPVTEVNRFIRSERQVSQLVLSDGLASISVFIEPVDTLSQRLKADPGSKKGSTHLYRKRIGDYWLTATGETPLETLHHLGNNTEFVPVVK